VDLGRELGQPVSLRGFSRGGYTSEVPRKAPEASGAPADPELLLLLRRNIEVQERLLKWKPRVYTELIKKDLETLENINRNRNL